MGLNVTVQKGHDFSTGNVTRAALNAAATPTVAITGSVSGTELAANSVTNAKIVSSAGIDLSKIAVPTGNLVLGSGGQGAALAPSADASAGILLANTGETFQLLKTGNTGDIDLTINSNLLRFAIKADSVEGSHLAANVADDVGIEMTSNALRLKQNGVTLDKLAGSGGNAGFITYGQGGNAEALTTTSAGKIPVTTSADPVLKVYNKIVPVATSISLGTKMTAAHGITVASGTTNHPHLVDWYFECTTNDQGYVVGDKVYSQCGFANESNFSSAYIDSTNVGIHINQMPRVPHKDSGNSTEPQLTTGSWKVMAIVSEY
jgi:hypothetical protein